jgi:ADP-ribose pyrophosphatase YjhB (NUDIX family)
MKVGVRNVLLTQHGKILLGERREDGVFQLPGGRVEKGESYVEAAVREQKEETNLLLNGIPKVWAVNHDVARGRMDVVLLWVDWEGELRCLDRKYRNFTWFSLKGLPILHDEWYGILRGL